MYMCIVWYIKKTRNLGHINIYHNTILLIILLTVYIFEILSSIDCKVFYIFLFSLCICLLFFSFYLLLPPLASFIGISAGNEKCNHKTRRRDVAWGNMSVVDKHALSCRVFLARFSILLGNPAICKRILDHYSKLYDVFSLI